MSHVTGPAQEVAHFLFLSPSDFAAILLDVMGNSTAYLHELFKSASILSGGWAQGGCGRRLGHRHDDCVLPLLGEPEEQLRLYLHLCDGGKEGSVTHNHTFCATTQFHQRGRHILNTDSLYLIHSFLNPLSYKLHC